MQHLLRMLRWVGAGGGVGGTVCVCVCSDGISKKVQHLVRVLPLKLRVLPRTLGLLARRLGLLEALDEIRVYVVVGFPRGLPRLPDAPVLGGGGGVGCVWGEEGA